jgi:hypothetical protein
MKKLATIDIAGILLALFQIIVFLCWIFEFGRIAFLQWYHIFAPTFFFVGYYLISIVVKIISWMMQDDERPRF